MIRFLLRRLLWFGITLFAVMSVSFFLMRSVKGGPFDNERRLDPVIEENIKKQYNLDWPLWKQFVQYVGPINLDEKGAKWFHRDEKGFHLAQGVDFFDFDGNGPWYSTEPGVEPFTGVLAFDLGPSFRYKD